jgi:hypothetical protein
MRERDGVHLADLHAREPRRLDGRDAGMGVARDMAGDAVMEDGRPNTGQATPKLARTKFDTFRPTFGTDF